MGALASRERGQTHHLEQLRSLFVEQGSPIVGCGRPQVGGFNVRHAPRVSAETNATVMFFTDPFASLTHCPTARIRADEGDRREHDGDDRVAELSAAVVVNSNTRLQVRAGRGVVGRTVNREPRSRPAQGHAGITRSPNKGNDWDLIPATGHIRRQQPLIYTPSVGAHASGPPWGR